MVKNWISFIVLLTVLVLGVLKTGGIIGIAWLWVLSPIWILGGIGIFLSSFYEGFNNHA